MKGDDSPGGLASLGAIARGAILPDGVDRRMDRRAVVRLSIGHLGADLFLGCVPALVPLFVAQRGMSYAGAGLLVLAGSLASALMQPLAGLAGDRLRAPWLAPLGLLLTGVGLGAATLTSAFMATAAALLVGGIGVAIFHPEAIRATRAAAGAQPGRALGIFAACGNVGFALGPALAIPLGTAFGLRAAGAVALVPLAAALLTAAPTVGVGSAARATPRSSAPADVRAFTLATASAVALSACLFGLMAFVPAWFGDELGASVGLGSAAVAGMLLAGAAGTYLAGRAGDAYGRAPVIAVALGALVPLCLLLPFTPAAAAFAVVLAIGLLVDGGYYPLLIVAQDALPERDGLAAGVVLGLSVGGGAGATALLGRLADAHGPGATLWACAALAAASLALAVPALRRRDQRSAASIAGASRRLRFSGVGGSRS